MLEKQQKKIIKQIKDLGPKAVFQEAENEIQKLIDAAGDDLKLIEKDMSLVAINSIIRLGLNKK